MRERPVVKRTTMNSNQQKVLMLIAVVIAVGLMYQFIHIDMKYFDYAMKIRTPKLMTMMVTAFCIGSASIVFQTVINNTIVTPCLLGMNSLYSLIHTGTVFVFGSASLLVTTKNLSFGIDLVLMGVAATLIYSYLFKKTKYNVLYVLLAGTVMATLFSSITDTLIRVMDPNEYETLQNSLIAEFNRVNSSIIGLSLLLILAVVFLLRKELALLNVIALGKEQAINLGVNYDRTIRRLLLGVTLFIAIATAMVGPISFLGLIIANLSRQLFKTYRHTYLIWGSALMGMAILLGGQALIEHVFAFNTTIAVFIQVGGGAYFLYLLLNNRR